MLAFEGVEADVLLFLDGLAGLKGGEVGADGAVGVQPDVPPLVPGTVAAGNGAVFQADGGPEIGGGFGVATLKLADDTAGTVGESEFAKVGQVMARAGQQSGKWGLVRF